MKNSNYTTLPKTGRLMIEGEGHISGFMSQTYEGNSLIIFFFTMRKELKKPSRSIFLNKLGLLKI